MRPDELGALAATLEGVRGGVKDGLAEWRYHGRLVARQLSESEAVVRCDFVTRDRLVRAHPGTFSVPARYERHMMVVANLAEGDDAAIEDALVAAWELQRRGS